MRHTQVPSVDVWEFLFERPEKPFPDDHVIFKSPPSEVRTYDDLRSQAFSFGTNLKTKWGWQKGDVMLFFAPNHIDVPALYWGCQWAGGIVSPANPTYTIDELKYQLDDSGAKALVVHAPLLHTAAAAAKRVGLPVAKILVVGDDSPTAGLQHVESMLANGESEVTRPKINAVTDSAFLVYSSGTTGRPKGAILTHINIVASLLLLQTIEAYHMDCKKDRILALLPTYHIFGMTCLVHLPVLMGIHTTIMEKFSVKSFLSNIQNESITHVYVAPPVVVYLAQDQAMTRERLTSLRMVTSGGAPLAPDLIRAVYDRLRIPVRQGFGLTESTGVSHIQRWDQWDHVMGSNGPPLPETEVKFIDQQGNRIKEGEGELCLRGPAIFPGYHNNDKATAQSFTADGWFKSGDLGFQDVEGNLFITDRLKDLIKFKGFQIPPAEIEGILHQHPLVRDVAVIGIFVKRIASEVPAGYVVFEDTSKTTEEIAEELMAYMNKNLAPHKRLRGGIIPINEIPRSPSGKVLKRVLRVRAEGVDKGKALGASVYDDRPSRL
ncbi:hypothetical protein N7457_005032 [Penicillium paradoxum]|uniref:uncharacterized protein n=1 Tax=Penicillium paradoxum TaxID=176176 RepID=UPI002548BB77|nr:uncharacterized protein N7457_005032 [Penicillium paradoxum]KAJ5783258.1 hypothetical protein N7457_005032 [Penicillium paradoxum]